MSGISLRIVKRQVLVLLILSVLLAIAGIIHGIFFDLDFAQVKRLTIEGIIFTIIVVFPTLLLLEWIFDINNKQELDKLNRRLNKLEKSVK